jgi:hypothetical protein
MILPKTNRAFIWSHINIDSLSRCLATVWGENYFHIFQVANSDVNDTGWELVTIVLMKQFIDGLGDLNK